MALQWLKCPCFLSHDDVWYICIRIKYNTWSNKLQNCVATHNMAQIIETFYYPLSMAVDLYLTNVNPTSKGDM